VLPPGESRAIRKLYRNRSLERFRTSSKYQDRPADHIAFCVAAYANRMTEDRIQLAPEDDYLSRDPSTSKRAMEKGERYHRCVDFPWLT
jgi:hypothetical protein